MSNKTDPRIEERVCELKRQGHTKAEIVRMTNVKEGTVKGILRRNGLTKNNSTPAPNDSLTPAHDEGGTANSTPQLDPLPRPAVMNSNLTQENTSNEIIAYVQFFRSRAKRLPYPNLSDHDKVWAETNYGKRWAEGIHMMINATGLSAEALMSAIDDCEVDVTAALERFNSKYRG